MDFIIIKHIVFIKPTVIIGSGVLEKNPPWSLLMILVLRLSIKIPNLPYYKSRKISMKKYQSLSPLSYLFQNGMSTWKSRHFPMRFLTGWQPNVIARNWKVNPEERKNSRNNAKRQW